MRLPCVTCCEDTTSHSKLNMKNHWGLAFAQVPEQAGPLSCRSCLLMNRSNKNRYLKHHPQQSPHQTCLGLQAKQWQGMSYWRLQLFRLLSPRMASDQAPSGILGSSLWCSRRDVLRRDGSQNHRTLQPHPLGMATKVAMVTHRQRCRDTVGGP